MLFLGVVENLEETSSSASEPFLSVIRENVTPQSASLCNQSHKDVVDIQIAEEESSTTRVECGEENQLEETLSERCVEDLSEVHVPTVMEEVNADVDTLMTVEEPKNYEGKDMRKPASLTVKMEIGETRVACNVSSAANEGIMEEEMVDSEHMEAAVLTQSMLKDHCAAAVGDTSGAVTEPSREERGISNIMEQHSAKCEQRSAEIKFGDGETTEEDSPHVSLAALHEDNGISQTVKVLEAGMDNESVSLSGSGGEDLLELGEPSYRGNQECAVENAGKKNQVYSAESTKEQGHHGVHGVTSSLPSSCSTQDTQSVVLHSLGATCTIEEEYKEATESSNPVGPKHSNLLSSHSEHHHSMLQKVHHSGDASSNAVDMPSTCEDKTSATKHHVCDNFGITAHLNVDQFTPDAILFTEEAVENTVTSNSSVPMSVHINCIKLIGGGGGYGETQNRKFPVTQPSHESKFEKQECASASCREVTFFPPSSMSFQSPSTEKSSQSELHVGTSTMVAGEDTSIVKVESAPLEVHFVREKSVVSTAHCVTMKGMECSAEITTTPGITVTLDEVQSEEGTCNTHLVARSNQECAEEEYSQIPLPNLNMCPIDLPDTMGSKQSTCRHNGERSFEQLTPQHSREVSGSKSEEIHVNSTFCVSAVQGKVSGSLTKAIKEIESAQSQYVEEMAVVFSVFDLSLDFDDQLVPSLYRGKIVHMFPGNSQFILAVDHVQCKIPSYRPIPNHNCGMTTPPSASSIQPTVRERPLFSQSTCTLRSSDITAKLPLEDEGLPLQLESQEFTVPVSPQHQCATKTIHPAKGAKGPCTQPCDNVEAVESFVEGMFVCLHLHVHTSVCIP